jgi:formylglycine-generating enzyme required for sulfatase activity
MIGNASEWTRSSYRSFPYRENDGRNCGDAREAKVARGGSFASRPREAGAAVRSAYAPWQSVYDVGFRVILEE